MEARLVLRVVAVEEQGGLVSGAEQGVGHRRAAEPINYCPRLQATTAHLQIVVDRLRGEVQELQVDPWKAEQRDRER